MKKILLGFAGLIGMLIAVATIALLTFNPDTYRPQLVAMLSKQTGRPVSMKGRIKLGLTLHGATLTIQDATIGNPSWASRPIMAGIGKFEFGIAFMPLLSHQLKITEMQIANADIQLESEGDKHNWDMAVIQKGTVEAKATAPDSTKAVTIEADHVTITDSQLAVRGQDGRTAIFKTSLLTYGLQNGGIAIHFDGAFNNTPATFDIVTNTNNLMANNAWPFNAMLTYGNYVIKAQGQADAAKKTASIGIYSFSANQSEIHGQMNVRWDGPKPELRGTIVSNGLNPADFRAPATINESGNENAAPVATGPKQVFSDALLPFDSLNSVNAAIEVNIAALAVGGAELQNVSSQITLVNGRLDAPLKAVFGKSTLGGTIKVDAAAKPPQVSVAFSGNQMELGDILALTHAPPFLTGKTDATLSIQTAGYSMHNLAGGANGGISIIADSGMISSSSASSLSSGLMELFAPKGNSALNCLAARFNIVSGIVKDNGILVDSSITTVAGKGNFNLSLETIDMLLQAKPKIANVGSLLPPLQIGGTLSSPSFHVDSNAVIQNVAGVLTSGSLAGLTESGDVPNVSGPVGTNACVYTLDHPSATTSVASKSSVLVPGVGGSIQKIKDAAPALLKGLLGQ